ncbi:hypothetical protein CYLTODRAFT_426514 [Cylindrobasidium torrendii FP15055 ss-10]|uniref:Protein OS-9 homolog n=1 Tax=Cylindrobasidium torrendii FP15055 ss-10 TaxID=1314674 RepID=A0A0D7B0A9_9AGAR|nr:hypothetical protein CYLTODRAFT_426514 [Cylindrobasidium torrendii FP15055 ss-10]
MMPMDRLLYFLLPALVVSKLLHSLPEDTHAFPKYKVSFLSHLPLANTTAEKWLSAGLEGGEREFLDQPFVPRKAIESGEDARLSPDTSYALEHMRMGPTDSYLCFIPKPLDPPLSSPPEEDPVEVSPEHSYSLLAPLAGHCLYHRQGWFTYSYCHGSEIRQFKERTNPPPTAGKSQYAGYKPEEDPKWESYTLGRAPQTNTDVAIRNGNIQLAHGGAGGSHYLVQTWGDGTMCDKSGRPREVQIQFHCSMTTSDNILFIKESKTCSYVLVINTPRLCSEPGFKTKRDATEQAYIQCRPVVDDVDAAKATVQDPSYYDFPSKFTRPQVHLPAPPKAKAVKETHPNDE